MTAPPPIYVYIRESLPLAEALSAYAQLLGTSRATALLYTPHRCEMAALVPGGLQNSAGQAADLAGVYEARVFCEVAELRWVDDPNAQPRYRAAILSEQDFTAALAGWQADPQRPAVIEALPQTYLLWGVGTGRAPSPGWSELAEAQIGSLYVPLPKVGKSQRVQLHPREYLIEADHGNAIIYDERLLKLEVASD